MNFNRQNAGTGRVGRVSTNTVFGRIRARGQRQRAGGGSTNGEARSRGRRAVNQFMAIG